MRKAVDDSPCCCWCWYCGAELGLRSEDAHCVEGDETAMTRALLPRILNLESRNLNQAIGRNKTVGTAIRFIRLPLREHRTNRSRRRLRRCGCLRGKGKRGRSRAGRGQGVLGVLGSYRNMFLGIDHSTTGSKQRTDQA